MKIRKSSKRPVRAAFGYFADDLNAQHNAELLQTLMTSIYEDMNRKKIGDVTIDVGDGRNRIYKINEYEYDFHVYLSKGNSWVRMITVYSGSSHDASIRAKFRCTVEAGYHDVIDEFYIPMSGSRKALEYKIEEIAESINGDITSSTVSCSTKRRAIKASGDEMVSVLNELTKGWWFYPINKFQSVIYNADDMLRYIDISDCVEFGTTNGQEVLIYDISEDGRKHIKYSCSMTTVFNEVVLENAYSDAGLEYEADMDAIWDELSAKNNWDGSFEASTKTSKIKKAVKASIGAKHKAIMAGAGAGITLKLADLTFTEVPNSGFYNEYNEYHDFLEPENGACKGTIEIESIGTYYDGGNPNTGVISVSIFVEEVTPYDAEDAQQMMSGTLKDVIDEFDEFEPTIRIGGGWTRVTFDGTFEVEGYSGYSALKLKVEIEDKDMVRWLDRFANGEADDLYYDICINGNPNGNSYYSQEDAIATAKEYAADPDYADDEITVEMRHYATDYIGDIMYFYYDDGDVVWNSDDALYE